MAGDKITPKKLLDPLGIVLKDDPPPIIMSAPPAAAPPVDMPVSPDMATASNAPRRRSIASQLRRRGRASTILTDITSEPLGG